MLWATLTFGENPRFATQFTSALPDADDSIADSIGGNVERGRQSTTDASPGDAALVAAEVWP